MSRPRRLVPLTLLVLTLALLVSCASGSAGTAQISPAAGRPAVATPAATPPPFPFTLHGTDGSSVKLSKAPERIISLSAGSTETLFAIGAGKQVIAADRFSDFPEAVKSLPKVEYTRPSVESLAAHRPDLILGAGRHKDIVAAVQDAGLPVVLLEEPATVAGVIERVRLLGQATGHQAEAEQLATAMDRRIKAVTDRLAAAGTGPRVFHEVAFSTGIFSATSKSFVGDIYSLLHARNIADSATGAYPQLSQEVVVQADPEVIVLADGREGVTPEQVRARPGWNGISAVRSGRIHLLTDVQADMISRPGPRVADAIEQFAALLYPTLR